MKIYRSLADIKADLSAGTLTCRELVQSYINRIEERKSLNAILEFYPDEALAEADKIQQKIDNGTAGKLAGLVVSLKDVFCHNGHSLKGGSKILEGFKSQFNATPVQRMLDEDAIVIGRNNCDEFAMGSSNENSAYGPVRNAADETRVPGGSSGGSAVSVQADLCLASIGSDTGGSVRQPSSFCGVIGFKPTYGRISRHGLTAYASSFDCVGSMTHTVEDAALMLEVMSGSDAYDDAVSFKDVPKYSEVRPWDGIAKIASFDNIINHEALASSVRDSVEHVFEKLSVDKFTIDMVDFKYLDHVLPTYYILTTAEASANLSRFDGVKFGYRSESATDLESMYKRTRSEGFGHEVIKRILLGTYVLSEGFHDAYFTKAQKVRRLIRDETMAMLEAHDFIITPTAPTPAFKLHAHDRNPLEMYLEDIFTVQASLAGLPAISLPNGTDENGLPIGIQIVANKFEEEKLLSFSKYLMDNYLGS